MLCVRVFLVILGSFVALIAVEFLGNKWIGYPPISVFVLHELPFRGERFSSEKWVAAESCDGLSDRECSFIGVSCLRGPMVNDLLKNHLRPGIATHQYMTQLLGPAQYRLEILGEACDGYNLGMCSGFAFDYDSLYICSGDDGRVTSAGHIQH